MLGSADMIGLYNLALLPLRGVVGLWATWQGRREPRRQEWAERLARRMPEAPAGAVWLHGASVGEARIVGHLARTLRARAPARPVVVSAMTPTGRKLLPAPPKVDAAFFVPLDFPGRPRRLLEALRPAALALVETELWPNLVHEAYECGVPVVVLNGRLSTRYMGRYRRWSSLYRPLLTRLAAVGAQSDQDAARFAELGVAESVIEVTGNVKYDLPAADFDRARLRAEFHVDPRRPVLAAGSTRPGEEPLMLDALAALRHTHPDTLLILAPRHPPRADEVDRIVRERGLSLVRFSETGAGGVDLTGQDVLLVDTVGQLRRLYGLAWVAFVGGSLVPLGGHNMLEPAALGLPVGFGPHTQDFQEPATALLAAGGGFRVHTAEELAGRVAELFADPDGRREMGRRGERVVDDNRGALDRSIDLMERAMSGQPATPVADRAEA